MLYCTIGLYPICANKDIKYKYMKRTCRGAPTRNSLKIVPFEVLSSEYVFDIYPKKKQPPFKKISQPSWNILTPPPQKKNIYIYYFFLLGARQGEARVGARPLEKKWSQYGRFFATFSLCGGLFATFPPYGA